MILFSPHKMSYPCSLLTIFVLFQDCILLLSVYLGYPLFQGKEF